MADSAHTPGEEQAAAARPAPRPAAEALYSERLYVAWWAWPLPLAAAVLIAAEIHMGFPAVPVWLPYLVLVPLAVFVLVRMSMTKVALVRTGQDTELHAGDARLPVRFVGQVDVVEKDAKRKAMGPELDPAAYVVHRGWIGTMVRVHLTDPDDPTPYWLFSTRKPHRLAELLRAANPAADPH